MHALPELRGQAVQYAHQPFELSRRIDILFPVRTDQKIILFRQVKARQGLRSSDPGQVIVQDLIHGTAGLDDPIGRQAFAQ